MDSYVFINLIGDKETQRQWLRSPTNGRTPFKPGALDEFTLNFDDIGKIKSIRIGFDNSGFSNKWHIDYVLLKKLDSNETYKFSYNSWLIRDKTSDETDIVLNLNEHIEKIQEPVAAKFITELNLKKVEVNDSDDDFGSKPETKEEIIEPNSKSMLNLKNIIVSKKSDFFLRNN